MYFTAITVRIEILFSASPFSVISILFLFAVLRRTRSVMYVEFEWSILFISSEMELNPHSVSTVDQYVLVLSVCPCNLFIIVKQFVTETSVNDRTER